MKKSYRKPTMIESRTNLYRLYRVQAGLINHVTPPRFRWPNAPLTRWQLAYDLGILLAIPNEMLWAKGQALNNVRPVLKMIFEFDR